MAFVLTFQIDGEIYREENLEAGAAISAPTPEERDGFDFAGWENLPAVMPAENTTIEGRYTPDSYTLTTMVDDEVWQTFTFSSGADLSDVPMPEKQGYTFSGWVKKYKKMPRSNLTLRGSFRINRYTLSFEVDGMTFEEEFDFGEPLNFILEPEREHYAFSGWGEIPETMPAHDLRFVGSFTPVVHTLTFVLNGETIHTAQLAFGAPIIPPEVDVPGDATFSGWKKMPSTMPNEDLTLEGKFRVKKYKVTFYIDDKKYAWVSLAEGARITPPDTPEIEGRIFEKWQKLPAKMPAKNLEVHAVFREEA